MNQNISLKLFLIATIIGCSYSQSFVFSYLSGGESVNDWWNKYTNIWLMNSSGFKTQPATLTTVNKELKDPDGKTVYNGFQINFGGEDIIFKDTDTDCVADNGCKIGTTKSIITVAGDPITVFEGTTSFSWIPKQGIKMGDQKMFSIVPLKDEPKNSKYQYSTRSIGFKPTASIFTYLNG
jgi:hypothetical protein